MTFRNASVNWAIRQQSFRQISISGMIGSLITNGGKIIAGLFTQGVMGLIIATVVGTVAAVIVYLKFYWKQKKK
jgi:hypothetical protein